MKKLPLLILATLLFSAAVYPQNTSVYTSTRTSACRTLESSSREAGSYVGECRGAGGYKVQLVEGDIRQTLNVVTPGREKFELNFWGFFGSFSSIGEKLEWRMKGGVPVALIARYIVSDPGDSRITTSYLMVSKIAPKVSCVTDIVKPEARQNEEARRLADTARERQCKPAGRE